MKHVKLYEPHAEFTYKQERGVDTCKVVVGDQERKIVFGEEKEVCLYEKGELL